MGAPEMPGRFESTPGIFKKSKPNPSLQVLQRWIQVTDSIHGRRMRWWSPDGIVVQTALFYVDPDAHYQLHDPNTLT